MGAITGVLHLEVRGDVDSTFINVNNADMPRSMNEEGTNFGDMMMVGCTYFGQCTTFCMGGAMIYISRTIDNIEPIIPAPY